jgi:hypothetical protein
MKRKKSTSLYLVILIITVFMLQVGFAEKKKSKPSKEQVSDSSKDVAMRWLTQGQQQFKADCELSGGTYMMSSGLGKCCWANWGCLKCQSNGNCTMECETKECEDAQLVTPRDFLEAAKEMELCRESSNDFLHRLTGYKRIKDQVLALDRKTDKIIKEGHILLKKSKLKCCQSLVEVRKTHNRLLEIIWEIRQDIKKRKALLEPGEKSTHFP